MKRILDEETGIVPAPERLKRVSPQAQIKRHSNAED